MCRIVLVVAVIMGLLGSQDAVHAGKTGSWTYTGSLLSANAGGIAALLPNGKVLSAGDTAELYDPRTRLWTATGRMLYPLPNTATVLHSGNVLVFASGFIKSSAGRDQLVSHAEVYSFRTGTWIDGGHVEVAMWGPTAILLRDGKVLLVGGRDTHQAMLASAQVYDPATNRWTKTSSMNRSEADGTGTLLPDGRVLVVGGGLDDAEVYDPRTRSWANTGPLVFASALHAATLLPDGEVLIAGGYGAIAAPTANAELYDPASNTWKPTGSMHSARATDSATLLSDGRVLVSGGMTKCDLFAADQSACVLARTELYTPSTGRWTETAPMHSRRFAFTATLLHTGQVLVVGGYSLLGGKPLSSSELYSP